MPVENKYFAIPSITYTEPLRRVESTVIMSNNFSSFLRSDGPTPSLETGLADKLKLTQYKQYFQKVAKPSRKAYVHSADLRQEVLPENAGIFDPVIQRIFSSGRDRRQAQIEEKGDIERGLTEYFDPLSQKEQATDVIDGVYGGVVLNVFDLIRQGKDPGMAVHKHPVDSMFSFVDWTLFLYQRGDGTDARPVKALGLICPNIQIIAQVTQDTPPVMDDQGMLSFLQHWNERFDTEGQEELNKLEEQQHEVVSAEMSRWRERMNHGFAKIEHLVAKKQAGGLTQDEEWELSQEFTRAASMNLENFDPDSIEEYSSVKRLYFDTLHEADNRVRMELARWMKVGLYSATNMEDFSKFTA